MQEGDLDERPTLTAEGKHVIIIGGGDTGADCLGTSHRQGAASVHQFEIMPRPPDERPDANPWPTWPMIYRVSSAHEEGGEREYAINTVEFVGDDDGTCRRCATVRVEQVITDGRMSFEPVEGSEQDFPAELVLLAMGFTGPEQGALTEQFGVELDDRGNVARDDDWATNVDGVFVCGDMGRGQSLIVWAIAEGRSAAAAVDRWLMDDDPAAGADHARRPPRCADGVRPRRGPDGSFHRGQIPSRPQLRVSDGRFEPGGTTKGALTLRGRPYAQEDQGSRQAPAAARHAARCRHGLRLLGNRRPDGTNRRSRKVKPASPSSPMPAPTSRSPFRSNGSASSPSSSRPQTAPTRWARSEPTPTPSWTRWLAAYDNARGDLDDPQLIDEIDDLAERLPNTLSSERGIDAVTGTLLAGASRAIDESTVALAGEASDLDLFRALSDLNRLIVVQSSYATITSIGSEAIFQGELSAVAVDARVGSRTQRPEQHGGLQRHRPTARTSRASSDSRTAACCPTRATAPVDTVADIQDYIRDADNGGVLTWLAAGRSPAPRPQRHHRRRSAPTPPSSAQQEAAAGQRGGAVVPHPRRLGRAARPRRWRSSSAAPSADR